MMADIRCPMCGQPNPEELEKCQYCQARLKPLSGISPDDQPPIQAGDAPVKKKTAEFEKTSLPDASRESIHPGEAPTKKDTGELEKALPNWLRVVRNTGTLQDEGSPAGPQAPQQEPPPAPNEVPPEDLPPWLAGESAGGDEEIPDWLASLSPLEPERPRPAVGQDPAGPAWPSDQEQRSSEMGAGPQPVSGLPDWFSSPDSQEPHGESPAGLAEEPASGEPGGLPEWLSRLTGKDDQPVAGQTLGPVEPVGESHLPPQDEPEDWSARLPSQEPPVTPQAEQPAPPADPQSVAAFESQGQPAEALTPEAGEPAISAEPPAGAESGQSGPPPPSALIFDDGLPGGDVEALFSEMPDWLSEAQPGDRQPAPPGTSDTGMERDELAPAELPGWVKSMQPVESVVPETPAEEQGEQAVETQGPLAGLAGTLSGYPGIQPTRKPQAYATKLQVSESQQSHAALLEAILEEESRPRPLTSLALPAGVRFLRWGLSLLLLLAVALTLGAGTQWIPIFSLAPDETLAASRVIGQNLPPAAPVLLAFDYDPAQSGELEAAAAPVIDHLMLRGARLTMLSTSPTGPALADRLLARTRQAHGYQYGEHFINLGYLPGGATGILNFVLDPAGTMPMAADNRPAWLQPPLAGVGGFSDFAAVIVLTGSSETGRLWLEQAGPYLSGTPLLMVVSAQAEPLLRPYYEAGQLQGMVGGLGGGAAYEQSTGRSGLSRRYWDAYSIGLTVVVFVLLVGLAWHLLTFLQPRRGLSGKDA
jgi:hypothetical protein